jgi:hypothetical protein
MDTLTATTSSSSSSCAFLFVVFFNQEIEILTFAKENTQERDDRNRHTLTK